MQRQLGVSNVVDPFCCYPYFKAKMYSSKMCADLEIVHVDWVMSHYARWEVTPEHAVVLNLSRVRHFLVMIVILCLYNNRTNSLRLGESQALLISWVGGNRVMGGRWIFQLEIFQIPNYIFTYSEMVYCIPNTIWPEIWSNIPHLIHHIYQIYFWCLSYH